MTVKHDSGKQRWDFLPFDALNEVVKVYTWGHEVKGYGPENWKTVKPRDRYFAALLRHITERRSGNIYDQESKLFIWAHVIFNALCLLWFDLMESKRVRATFVPPFPLGEGSSQYPKELKKIEENQASGTGRLCKEISFEECHAIKCKDCDANPREER